MAAHRALRVASTVAVIIPLAGCATTINGVAYRGDMSVIDWAEPNAMPAQGQPAAGASITVMRDPTRPSREVVGRGVAGQDGTFSIKLDAFGAGWMEEEWLIRVAGKGGSAEYLGPLQPDRKLIAIISRSGGDSAVEMWQGGAGTRLDSKSLIEESKRY
jgi:hypothetical protein